MPNDVEIFDRLLEITVLLQTDLASSFEGTGLTTARTHLLWELHQLGPSTQQALATRLGVSARNVTGLVDALETHGYLERQRHPTDRRALLVTLTDRGVATMTKMTADREQAAAQLVADLDREQRDQLSSSLEVIAIRLRAMVDAAATPEVER